MSTTLPHPWVVSSSLEMRCHGALSPWRDCYHQDCRTNLFPVQLDYSEKQNASQFLTKT